MTKEQIREVVAEVLGEIMKDHKDNCFKDVDKAAPWIRKPVWYFGIILLVTFGSAVAGIITTYLNDQSAQNLVIAELKRDQRHQDETIQEIKRAVTGISDIKATLDDMNRSIKTLKTR